jgi:hypothetical protein
MSKLTKTFPAKIQESEVVRIRLTGDKYARLTKVAVKEKRKISNMAQVMLEEGIEKRENA